MQNMEWKRAINLLGVETLQILDSVMNYQKLVFNMIQGAKFQEREMRLLGQLWDAADTAPRRLVRIARAKCIRFLHKLNADDHPGADVHGEVSNGVRNQNGRINSSQRNRNQHYRIMAKRNACKTSRKSESNRKKISKYSKSANSGKASQSHVEDVQPNKLPNRQRLKRKAEELNIVSGSKSDIGSSRSVNKKPTKEAEPTKKLKSDLKYSGSTIEHIKLKSVVIKLKDFMKDPSADNDQYVAQYKQANCDKINEEEFQVVDDMGDDSDDDQIAYKNQNSHNDGDVQEDRILLITTESGDDQLEQEHRTPSLSPRATRCPTPPGLEPTSDSKV